MIGYVYILKSEINNRYYVGSTNNIERRLEEHNKGESKYTKLTKPFSIVFYQEFENIRIARQVEYKIKKYKSRSIIEKVISDGKIRVDLKKAERSDVTSDR
jgi:putative endonuclease